MSETLADALQVASTSADDWHKAHQGELLAIEAFVWECRDDCRCTEAQIVAWFRNVVDRRCRVPRQLWCGEFHADGEYDAADDELARKRREVEAAEPELAARIAWPE